MKQALFLPCAALLLLSMSGCAAITGMLRKDLDDAPEPVDPATRGGKWAERGLLDEEPGSMGPDSYGPVGHHDRSPAEYSSRGGGRSSWITPDNRTTNERDGLRGRLAEGEESYRNNPQMSPSVKRQYRNGARATRSDFLDEAPNEGSLWASDGQTNYYFTKNRVRGMGDIIGITIEEPLIKDMGVELARTLTTPEKQVELAIVQEKLNQKANGTADRATASQAAPARGAEAPAGENEEKKPEKEAVEAPRAKMSDVDITQCMGVKAGEQFMTEIVQRYPNGNYKVRGTKRIPYRGGSKLVSLLGVVKGTDITDEETVTSGKLYEYRVEIIQ